MIKYFTWKYVYKQSMIIYLNIVNLRVTNTFYKIHLVAEQIIKLNILNIVIIVKMEIAC